MTTTVLPGGDGRIVAAVADGALVAALPRAVPPSVLRVDLARLSDGALEVAELGGRWTLVRRGSDGPSVALAAFEDRRSADEALAAAARALLARRGAPPHTAGHGPVPALLSALAVLAGVTVAIALLLNPSRIGAPRDAAVSETLPAVAGTDAAAREQALRSLLERIEAMNGAAPGSQALPAGEPVAAESFLGGGGGAPPANPAPASGEPVSASDFLGGGR